jgi:hypothetical protein
MRSLTGHKVTGVNDGLTITVVDEPGAGGANHEYKIDGVEHKSGLPIGICFQNGPIKEKGVNGLTHEVLLEIIKDRLQCFQSGPYACVDNAEALAHIEAAQECLLRRTRARAARGVEGTMIV